MEGRISHRRKPDHHRDTEAQGSFEFRSSSPGDLRASVVTPASSFKSRRIPADEEVISSFPGLKDANDPVDAFE